MAQNLNIIYREENGTMGNFLQSIWDAVKIRVLGAVGARLYMWFASQTNIADTDQDAIVAGFLQALDDDINSGV